ncbi:MAG TPA: hemerythrin domain-containing protein [Burkholderiales bacterium]|nr:hemerythrin domain-containing protein [Burkholderiales bacterium]
MNPVQFWHAEHVYFGHLLDLLRRQLDLLHRGERPNFQLILDVVSYLRDYGDECHHPREDKAFERLLARCPDLKQALARLHQEHRVIAGAGERLRELIDAALQDSPVRRAELETALATYLVYYGNHIAREEEDVLTRAAQSLTQEDWDAVKAAVPAKRDPLFGGHPEARYRELRRQLALEA